MEVADKNGQEIAESYLSSLVDLTTNSKPLINMLTMLAEENVEHGQTIVDAVHQRITKVDPDLKLPILYLIDSIVKNVGGVYTVLFSRTIVNIFVAVFEKVNEHVRQKMFQLRRTWDGVFPLSRLHMLDYQISKIDPNWPTTQPCNTTKIHLNPKFPVGETEKNLQTELQIKQRELLELKKKKLELELAATQKQLGGIPGIGTGVGMEIAANPVGNHVYNPQSVSVPPARLEKTPPVVSSPVYDMNVMVPPVPPLSSGTGNVRQKIAPANAALIQSMRVRDPRLMRQPTPTSGQTITNTSQILPPGNTYNHKSITDANGPLGPIPRINNNNIMNNNNNNVHRNQRIQSQSIPNDNTTIKFSNNNPTSSNTDDKHNTKSSRSSSTSHKTKSQNNKSGSSGSSKTMSSSTKGGSSSKGESRSSRTSSSSSLSSKKLSASSKNRKDDKSPQRKKSSSRHRSPTSNRRSTSPVDTTKSSSSRSKSSSTSSSSSSSYNSKLKNASSTSSDKHKDSHSKDKSNSNSNISNSQKTSPSATTTLSSLSSSTMSPNHKHNRDYSNRLRNSRSKSPSILRSHSIVDGCTVSKDIDLRAQLSAPINLVSNQLTSTPTPIQTPSTILNANDNTTTVPLIASIATNMVVSDRNSRKNSDTCGKSFLDEAAKDIDFRMAMAIPGIAATQPSKSMDSQKRVSIDERENEEPKGKKTKTSEKIDVLFGTEDVDLRIPPALNPITSPSAIIDDDTTIKGHKSSKTTKSSKPKRHDIDLRKRDLLDENPQKSSFLGPDEANIGVSNMNKHKSKKMTTKSNNNKDAAFSSGSDDESLKQSHRVPKRRRVDSDKLSPNKLSNVPSNKSPVADVPPKERRVRKTKWSSPWEDQNKVAAIAPIPAIPTVPFAALGRTAPTTLIAPIIPATDNLRQFSSRSVPETIWQQNVIPMVGPSATVNPLGLIGAVSSTAIPPPSQATAATTLLGNNNMPPVVVAQSSLTIGTGPMKERTINIDGIPREIRFYNEIAIAFMEAGGKEPKEIGFQSGERRLCVDNTEQIILAFNDTYKPILINNKQYQIRFGSPTRELYIDNEWYECYFGDPPVHILLDNELHIFRIDGPAPQVRIGNLRMDLVVGKVDMYIGTTTKVTLFLDGQLQFIDVNNQQHTIQFADSFLTVLIDNVEFPNVRYGGMPEKYCIGNALYYIRFSVLPKDVVPGKTFVRNMKRTKNHPELDLTAPTLPPPMSSMPVSATAAAVALNSSNIGVTMPVSIPPVTGPILPLMSIQTQGLDLLAGTSSNSSIPSQPTASSSIGGGVTNQQTNVPVISKTDINDLFQKLLATGIINKPNAGVTKSPPAREQQRDPIIPVSLRRPETLKKRQSAIVKTLFSGVQCGDCGIRFPSHETQKYGQHLDWHYRQNRREKDSARKASSRKWYYGISDWIQYEEIENLEERERNFFETQNNDGDATNGDSVQRPDSPPPSCVAGSDDHNKTCDMCHDLFETFYNEETEEWHLRNAVRIEENTYHPVCYDDYKASLTLDESNLNVPHVGDISTADDNAVDMEMKDETNSIGLIGSGDGRIPVLDDDDDVIVLPQDEPIITEIPDDDEPKNNTSHNESPAQPNDCCTKSTEHNGNGNDDGAATITATGCSQSSDAAKNHNNSDLNEDGNHNESDVQILEPHISIMNLDEYDESKALSATLDEAQTPVKIKKEPKYEGYDDPDEDDGFEDVGTFEGDPIELMDEASADEYVPQSTVSSQPTLIASIDGNVELHEAQPPTIGTNKIKINITKNVQLNKNSINSSELDDNLAINNRELKLATVGLSTGQAENSENYVANDTDGMALSSGNQATTSTTTNKNDGRGGGGDSDSYGAANEHPTLMDAQDIEYEVKESIKHVQFKRQPIVRSESVETSGLCSIM